MSWPWNKFSIRPSASHYCIICFYHSTVPRHVFPDNPQKEQLTGYHSKNLVPCSSSVNQLCIATSVFLDKLSLAASLKIIICLGFWGATNPIDILLLTGCYHVKTYIFFVSYWLVFLKKVILSVHLFPTAVFRLCLLFCTGVNPWNKPTPTFPLGKN